MPVSQALRRLLRIRELEEEQSKLALEAALGELHRAERAMAATAGQDRRGRMLVESSARSGELRDRMAGIEESRTAERLAAALEPVIAGCEREVATLREFYLEKRVQRRQAETLIQEAEAEDAIDSGRRTQQALDDWFSSRIHRRRGLTAAEKRRSGKDEDLLNHGEAGKT